MSEAVAQADYLSDPITIGFYFVFTMLFSWAVFAFHDLFAGWLNTTKILGASNLMHFTMLGVFYLFALIFIDRLDNKYSLWGQLLWVEVVGFVLCFLPAVVILVHNGSSVTSGMEVLALVPAAGLVLVFTWLLHVVGSFFAGLD